MRTVSLLKLFSTADHVIPNRYRPVESVFSLVTRLHANDEHGEKRRVADVILLYGCSEPAVHDEFESTAHSCCRGCYGGRRGEGDV